MIEKYNTTLLINESINLFANNLVYNKKLDEKSIKYSLFAILVLDIMANKEELVEKDFENQYNNLMSDNTIDNIYNRLNVNKEEYNMNESTFFAKLRGTIAHGKYYIKDDRLILNIEINSKNKKECSVLLDDFIDYYCELTDFIDGRIDKNKFEIYEVFNKNEDTLTTLSSDEKCIREYLNGIILKKITFSKIDKENLLSDEKFYLHNLIFNIRKILSKENINHFNNKAFDRYLSEYIKNSPFSVGINNYKVGKHYNELKEITTQIIDYYNQKNLDNINPYVTERLYNYMYNQIDDKQYKSGLLRTKYGLYHMYHNNINSFNTYIDISKEYDEYYALSYPLEEQKINLLISLLYFNYCYPLENNFKSSKDIYNENDLPFINLDFDMIKKNITINKLYENGIKNKIKELSDKKTLLINRIDKTEESITKKINFIEYLNESKKNKIENEINELKEYINASKNLLRQIECESKELSDESSIRNKNYYNYTIIQGIRDALAHGNVTYKNIYYNDIENTYVEFTDLYKEEIKFKLTIKIKDLIHIFEYKNTNIINDFYNEKTVMKST